jgi:GntR family transcriptional regulator
MIEAASPSPAQILSQAAPLRRERGAPPLFFQLAERLQDLIERLRLAEGAVLPTEREVSERFEVSRITARQALAELENQGLIKREQGRGTFVAAPKIPRTLPRMASFTDDMLAKGARPSTRLLEGGEVDPPETVAARLQLLDGDRTLRLYRLALANGRPIALLEAFLSPTPVLQPRFGDLLDASRNAQFSLYAALERMGIVFTHADEKIGATAATAAQGALLETSTGAPLLEMVRLSFVRGDQPVELVKAVYRGDRYQYQLRSYASPAEHGAT